MKKKKKNYETPETHENAPQYGEKWHLLTPSLFSVWNIKPQQAVSPEHL